MKREVLKRIILTVAAVIVIGVAIVTVSSYKKNEELNENGSTNSSSAGATTTTKNLTKAIDFTLKDLEGNEIKLSDLEGKKVLLNFWATWCPPCKEEMPDLEKLYQETKNSDLVIIAVDLGESLSVVKSFVNSNKYNFKVLLDSNQSVAAKYKVTSIPTSYFINEEGYVVSKKVGAMNLKEMKERALMK